MWNSFFDFFPTKSLKSLRGARIDEIADSNEPAIIGWFLNYDMNHM